MATLQAHWNTGSLAESARSWLPELQLEVLSTIDSTNTELMRRARNGCTSPTVLVAEHQSAGRGRLGRSWTSGQVSVVGMPAALTFSLGLPYAPIEWSGLSLAVGVAVADSLHSDIRLKWPNDLWLDGRKLAGILIETAQVGDRRYVVVGLGLNIRAPAVEGLSTAPAGLQELLPGCEAPQALARVLPALARCLHRFESQGFAAFAPAFAARDLLRGRVVVLSDGRNGTAAGTDASGGLLVHTSAGMISITSAEVSVRAIDGAAPVLGAG